MRRIDFLARNKAISGTIVDALLLARIEARHIQQHADLIPTLEQGLTLGGGTGLPSRG